MSVNYNENTDNQVITSNTIKNNNVKDGGGSTQPPPSTFDLFSGKHTIVFFVSILFAITLGCFVFLICYFKNELSQNIITIFGTLLGVFAGYFANSMTRKD